MIHSLHQQPDAMQGPGAHGEFPAGCGEGVLLQAEQAFATCRGGRRVGLRLSLAGFGLDAFDLGRVGVWIRRGQHGGGVVRQGGHWGVWQEGRGRAPGQRGHSEVGRVWESGGVRMRGDERPPKPTPEKNGSENSRIETTNHGSQMCENISLDS